MRWEPVREWWVSETIKKTRFRFSIWILSWKLRSGASGPLLRSEPISPEVQVYSFTAIPVYCHFLVHFRSLLFSFLLCHPTWNWRYFSYDYDDSLGGEREKERDIRTQIHATFMFRNRFTILRPVSTVSNLSSWLCFIS